MKSIKQVCHIVRRGLASNPPPHQQPLASLLSSQFDLTQMQQDLQHRARKFSEEHVTPTADRYDACAQYPWELHQKAFEFGVTPFAEKGPHGALEECLVGEEISAGCSAIFSTMASTATAASVLSTSGSEDIHQRYIALLRGQPLAAAFSVSDNHLIAKKQGTHFHLQSPPTFVPNAGNASFFLVIGRTSTDPECPPDKAYTGFVVDKHWLGVNVGQRLQTKGHRCCDIRSLSFENVMVTPDNIIGEEGSGLGLAKAAMARHTLMKAVGCLGVSRRATLSLLEHGCPPETPVLLRMLTRVEAARLLIRKVAVGIDRGKDSGSTSHMALIQAVEAATNNTIQALQSLGRDCDSNILTKLIRDASMYADEIK